MEFSKSSGITPERGRKNSKDDVVEEPSVLFVGDDGRETRSVDDATAHPNITVAELSLTFAQLKPFLNIAVPFFKEDKTARRSLIAVLALTLLNSAVSVVFR